METPCSGCPNEPPAPGPADELFDIVFGEVHGGLRGVDGHLDFPAFGSYLDTIAELGPDDKREMFEMAMIVEPVIFKRMNEKSKEEAHRLEWLRDNAPPSDSTVRR